MDDIQPVVNSPCVRLCTLNDKDICVGCGRTLNEICAWGESDDQKKRQIIEDCKRRLIAMNVVERGVFQSK